MQVLLCLLFYGLILVVAMTPFILSGWHTRREEMEELASRLGREHRQLATIYPAQSGSEKEQGD